MREYPDYTLHGRAKLIRMLEAKDSYIEAYKDAVADIERELKEAICRILDVDRGDFLDITSEEKYVERLKELEAV